MTPEGTLEKTEATDVVTAAPTLTPDQSIKDLITDISDVCNFIINVSKGFALKEIWEGVELLMDFRAITSDVPTIVAQYRGLDDESRAELLAYIQKNVVFPDNTSVQEVVEKLLEVAVSLSTVFQLVAPAK